MVGARKAARLVALPVRRSDGALGRPALRRSYVPWSLLVGVLLGFGTNLVTANPAQWWAPLQPVSRYAPMWFPASVVAVLGWGGGVPSLARLAPCAVAAERQPVCRVGRVYLRASECVLRPGCGDPGSGGAVVSVGSGPTTADRSPCRSVRVRQVILDQRGGAAALVGTLAGAGSDPSRGQSVRAELRNELGIGHGRSTPSPALARHARLALNSTVTVTEFLLDTWQDRVNSGALTLDT